MQLVLQASPFIDRLKHWRHAVSFNEIQLTTSQKVMSKKAKSEKVSVVIFLPSNYPSS